MALTTNYNFGLSGLRLIKHKARLKKRKARKASKIKGGFAEPPRYRSCMGDEFYLTREWRELRWKTLLDSDGRCKMCGASKKDGAIMHVDHIYPRSRFPSKELDPTNMQVLCAPCNLGKRATIWKSE